MSWLLNRLRRAGRHAVSRPSLAQARDGNVAMIFGLSLIPMVGLIGLGVDYGVAITNKTKLDGAADAAAVAAVATAKAYIAANQGKPNLTAKAIAAGITQATNVFNVNAGKVPFTTYTLQTPQLVPSGQTLTSTVAYTATVTNTFGRLFRTPTTPLANTAVASTDLASYLDFYLMVDVSGSMGLPALPDGMRELARNNQDMIGDYKQGCQFACHFPTYNGWTQAAGKIQLRSDAVNTAVCSLLQRASNPTVQNQYRIGIYPFINQLATLAALTGSITSLNAAAQCSASWPLALTNLLDTGTTQLFTGNDMTTGTGAGGTHFETSLTQMKSTITSYGDGSSTSRTKPFVFLVTDGMQNSQHFYVMKNGKYAYPGNPSMTPNNVDAWWDRSQPSQIDPDNCTTLKNAGATISILYTPYNIIDFTNYGGGIASENITVNGFSPTLSTPLSKCASPGYFYTANTPDDITASLNKMFDQALKMTRLTQ
ncbi:pilus assembly protein TadG-related protein [Methylobacterium sp. E-041]|uniref:TadE/TadG family type IV pilus assembly protein n=1 Tax=Methylobacterium sp. E-041 TaxID=2836573 RepID=UPI001FBB2069|nr:pilus assembly protein TadG-related protein [Methylobacterium sp. E-041]MCJ2106440.1 pilus assembly protein TadG-related protein [Methylobacterium sp. E-041]